MDKMTTEGDVILLKSRTCNENMEIEVSSEKGNLMETSAQNELLLQGLKLKRKHRRGARHKKGAKLNRKNGSGNFQYPRYANQKNKNGLGGSCLSRGGRGHISAGNRNCCLKLERSQSLVPYNTNKFLMEEHMAELSSAMMTPSGRTRDSSFSVDSEDNNFFSLPEDEEDFLSKEFSDVYEQTRRERLEVMSKQQLIEECLALEDRYSSDQGTQRKQQFDVQRFTAECTAKLRVQEELIRQLKRDNHNLRSSLMHTAAVAAAGAAASPPSAAAPTASARMPILDQQYEINQASSEDSESDSSSSTSSSSSSSSSSSYSSPDQDGHEEDMHAEQSPGSSPGTLFKNNNSPLETAEQPSEGDDAMQHMVPLFETNNSALDGDQSNSVDTNDKQ